MQSKVHKEKKPYTSSTIPSPPTVVVHTSSVLVVRTGARSAGRQKRPPPTPIPYQVPGTVHGYSYDTRSKHPHRKKYSKQDTRIIQSRMVYIRRLAAFARVQIQDLYLVYSSISLAVVMYSKKPVLLLLLVVSLPCCCSRFGGHIMSISYHHSLVPRTINNKEHNINSKK